MTLPELIDALWQARITVTLREGLPCAQPAQALAENPDLLKALKEHREALVTILGNKATLAHFCSAAKLQGLECGTCANHDPTEKLDLYWCPTCAWSTPHYPRK